MTKIKIKTNEQRMADIYKKGIVRLLDVISMEAENINSTPDLFDIRRKLTEMVSCMSGHSEETVSKFCEE